MGSVAAQPALPNVPVSLAKASYVSWIFTGHGRKSYPLSRDWALRSIAVSGSSPPLF